MDRETAKQECKNCLRDYLEQVKGIKRVKSFSCLNPDHPDKHPSMGLAPSGENVYCQSCHSSYDIFDLIAMDNGLDAKRDFPKVLEIACNMFNISLDEPQKQYKSEQISKWKNRKAGATLTHPTPAPVADYSQYFKECMARIGETDYLQKRGISPETAKKFWIGYDSNYTKSTGGKSWQAVIIPTSPNSYVARNTDPNAQQGDRYRKTGASALFNLKGLTEQGNPDKKPVFIVEGEIDAISIEEAGGKALALGSTANKGLLIKHLENNRPKLLLLLALDNDETGKATQEELKEALDKIKIKNYVVDIYGAEKDANGALVANKEAFIEAIKGAEAIEATLLEQEKQEYLSTFASGKLEGLLTDIFDKEQYAPISTGFTSIDSVLDGGLYAGLYVVGAISSLGKTTFCIQIADQIAGQGHDVIIFSLEMETNEIMAKSISRETMNISEKAGAGTTLAKSTRGVLNGKRWENYTEQEAGVLWEAVERYSKYADHIKIIEGVGDIAVTHIREAVEKHIAITGNKPVVIIDYLQILAPLLDKATDKQNTDKAVLELKKLSRDFRTPIIAISSFNRDNYTQPVNLSAFKETGAVEYSSDVAIGLQYAGMDYIKGEKETERNARIREMIETNIARTRNGWGQDIQAKILKNRNGSKGEAVLEMYPMFNAYKEKPIKGRWEEMGQRVSNDTSDQWEE